MSTDGDDAWLEVFEESGTPLVSARLLAGELFGWDEFFGRTRQSIGLETLWNMKQVEGYSEPEDRAAAGQIPVDWVPTVTIDKATLHHLNNRLATIDFASPSTLTNGQRQLAHAGLEIAWNRVLRHQTIGPEPLMLPHKGALRIGNFVNPLDHKTYMVADWRDIDDASYTFYFERSGNMFVPVIAQYNN